MRILKRSMATLKNGKSNKQGRPMFKQRAPNQDGGSASKEKLRIGNGSQIIIPTSSTCTKRHYGEYLLCTITYPKLLF